VSRGCSNGRKETIDYGFGRGGEGGSLPFQGVKVAGKEGKFRRGGRILDASRRVMTEM